MKNTWKKTLAGLLAITLVAGAMPANVGGFLTGGKAIVAVADDETSDSTTGQPLEDLDIPQEANSDYVGYYVSHYGYDIYGLENGNRIQTSYGNYGYLTGLLVSDEEITSTSMDGTQFIGEGNALVLGKVYEHNGVQVRITPEISADGSSLGIKYDLYNNSDVKKYVKLGVAVDTDFNGSDHCNVMYTDNGLRLEYGGKKLNISLNDKAAAGKYTGNYSGQDYINHMWDNNDTYQGGDSALTWHWDYVLEPNQHITTGTSTAAGEFLVLEFNTNGGSDIDPMIISDATPTEQPEDPTRSNRDFLGWYADEDLTIPFEFGNVIEQDTMIYAKWSDAYAPVRIFNVEDARVIEEGTEDAIEPVDGVYKLSGNKKYLVYTTDDLLENPVLEELEDYDAVPEFAYCYELTIPEEPAAGGYSLIHGANWSGRVLTSAPSKLQITQNGKWRNAIEAAELHADDLYYFGDQPQLTDVTIRDDCTNVVSAEEVYFSNAQGTKVTDPNVGENYFVTAKVIVDQSGIAEEPNDDTSVLYLKKQVSYQPRPLEMCAYYLVTEDGDIPLNVADGKVIVPEGSFTYDGTEQAPVIKIVNPGDPENPITLTSDQYSIEGETSGTDAGDYTFTATAVDTNYAESVEVAWTIDKADADLAAEANDDIVYDGQELDKSDFTFSGDNVDILDLDDTTLEITAAEGSDITSAGEQDAVITITSKNYKDLELEVPAFIAQRDVTIAPVADQGIVYSDPLPSIAYTIEQASEEKKTGVIAKDAAVVAELVNTEVVPQILLVDGFNEDDLFANNVGEYSYVVNEELFLAAAAEIPVLNNYNPVYNIEDGVFTIEPKDIASEGIVSTLTETQFVFDGTTKITAVDSVVDGDHILTDGEDFTIGGTTQHLYPGSYRVQISGQGNYTGIAYANWKINSINGGASLDVLDNGSKVYDGVTIDKMITVNVGDIPADKATVSTVYKDSEGNVLDDVPVNAGEYTAEVTISAKGYTTQTLITDITVSPKPVTITGQLEKTNITYTDDAPAVTGWDFDGIIDDDKDDFLENTNVIWTATGNTYTGEVDTSDIFDQNYDFVVTPVTFTIDAKDINSSDVTVAYTEKAVLKNGVWTTCDDIVVTDTKTGKQLVEGEDYTVNGNTSKTTGNFTIELIGINNYTGVKEIPWDVVTSPEDAAISKIVSYQTYDDEGRVSFVVNNTYEGDKATKYGILIYRDEEPLAEDLTVNTEKAVNTEFNQPLATFRAKDIGNGINVRPYIIIEDEYVYGNQVNVDYDELKEAEALAAAKTEIVATSNYDNEGRITFAVSNVYSGTEEVKYGVLITRNGETANEELTFENAEVNSKFDIAVATFRAKDLGEGVTVKPYMIIGDTIVFGNQFTAYNTPQV